MSKICLISLRLFTAPRRPQSNWSTNWKLSFNESKCLLLTFQSKDPTPFTLVYSINGHAIRNCHQYKDLGILMPGDFSWTSYISSITNQAYKKLGLFRRSLCSGDNVSTKRMLYLSLIRSQLLYCSQVWRSSLVKEIKTIEDVQCHATKFILNNYIKDYRTRLLKLHILPLSMQHELIDIFFFRQIPQTSTQLLYHLRLCLLQWQQH